MNESEYISIMAGTNSQKQPKKGKKKKENETREQKIYNVAGFRSGRGRGWGGGGLRTRLYIRRFGGVHYVALRRVCALLWFCCGNKIHHNGIISERTKRKAIQTHTYTHAKREREQTKK